MTLWEKLTATSGARRDARFGLDSGEERVTAELGPRPEFDPVGNREHAQLVASLDPVQLDELREDLVRAEDDAEKHLSPTLLSIGLVVAVVIETVGAVLVVKGLGVSESERLPVAVALALAVVGITVATAHRSIEAKPDPSGRKPSFFSRVKRSIGTGLLYVVYGVFVAAITIARLRNAGGEDGTQIEALAEGALMLAAVIGPAWFAERLMRLRAPASLAWKRVRILRRRLRALERSKARAEAEVARITRAGLAWNAAAARRRAAYTTEHRLEAVKTDRKNRDDGSASS